MQKHLRVLGAMTLALVILTSGCATGIGRRVNDASNFDRLLPQWEQSLIKKYTKMAEPLGNEPCNLQFIVDYEMRYPQVSGLPEHAWHPDDNKQTYQTLRWAEYPAFNDLTAEEIGRSLNAERIIALEKQQAMLDVESDINAKAILEARLALKQAELMVLNTAPEANAKEIEPLETTIRELETTINEIENEIRRLAQQINTAKKSALQKEIDALQGEIEVSGSKGDEPLKDSLKAKAIYELARAERNRIIGELCVIAKRVHDAQNNSLHYSRATINGLFDFTQIISSSVASVAGSEGTARALAALSTAAGATQESVDRRYFYEHATTALVSTMKRQRHVAEEVLVVNMSKSVMEYPLQVALSQYADFLVAGTLVDALSEMGADASIKEMKASATLDSIKKSSADHIEVLKEISADKAAEQAARDANVKKYTDLLDEALYGYVGGTLPGIMP
jgi:hypothetical protein